ncbi:hypothetical protein J4731_15205 [Providencia rettgeri]|nr:hypothetical protein [Providencia rettgeri]
MPARICWVGLGDRAKLGLAFNEMVRSGEVSAPIVMVVTIWIQVQWPAQTVKQNP